ncbi:MAG TPA: alpha/beta hydrolase domain-containing protein [Hyphomonadaceae bacterium]|nr:alpha/beta hydrolase domain-containing protein [Hyphomonadaceae bacterium]
MGIRIACAALALLTASCMASPPPAPTSPSPFTSVVGPVAQSEASHAFGGAAYTLKPEELAKEGYVEEEFFVSGKANIYDWPATGAVVKTPDAPYTTRVLVRRPISRSKFSGRVLVEMMNPSNLFDLNIGWAIQHEEILRSGDAWVAFTAKPVAVATLKQFDPQRYASLSWKNPLPVDDPRNCAVSGDSTKETENGLVWDIHTQMGQWLRSSDPTNPFRYGGNASAAKRLYAWGYSQTGGFLFTYINAIRPLVVARTGKEPFDAYSVAMLTGPSPISQCAERIPPNDPRMPIRNAGVPVIHIMSQSDYLGWAPRRREDSDKPGDQYRHYDLAGAGHATPDELWYAARNEDLVKAGRTPPAPACDQGPRSRFPSPVPFNAIFHNLKDWTEKGIAPPPSQNIEVVDGKGVLDEHGNVKGGIRTPFLDVPTSVWSGNSTGQSFCRIAGNEQPFSKEKLAQIYPSQAAYEAAVAKDVDALVKARFIVKEDGEALKKQAAETKVR